jgi:hypothetical protein
MLVLDGNIPRFPWEPSTTMLTNRLVGTTEASVSYRNGPHHSGCPTALKPWVATRDRVAQSSLVTASPERALGC